MSKTLQDLKIEIKVIRKTQTEGILEKKIWVSEQKLYTQASLIEYKRWKRESQALKIQLKNRLKNMVKENGKSNIFLTQNIQIICKTIKRLNIRLGLAQKFKEKI